MKRLPLLLGVFLLASSPVFIPRTACAEPAVEGLLVSGLMAQAPMDAGTISGVGSTDAAPPPLDLDGDPNGALKMLVNAFETKNWGLLASVAVFAIVWAVRKWVAPMVPFFATKLGGILLTLGTSVSGATLTSVMAGQAISPALIIRSLWIGVSAAGVWTILKNLVEHFTEAPAVPVIPAIKS